MAGGFIVGSASSVYFYSYDETSDQVLYDSQFRFTSRIETEHTQGVMLNIAMSPNEEKVCAITSDNQLLEFPITSPQSLVSADLAYAVCPFHGPKSITGMDTCVLKPLFITICKDNTLRVWNFQTHTPDLTKVFLEDMYSVAMHPTGMHCAVGFTDKLRLYHILVDDLRLCMELPIKGCKQAQFSDGGNVIAAANGNSINVYDFHTGEKLADLRGHNSKVRDYQRINIDVDV